MGFERLGRWQGIEVYKGTLADYDRRENDKFIYVIEDDGNVMIYQGNIVGHLDGNTVEEADRRTKYTKTTRKSEKVKNPEPPVIQGSEDMDAFFAQLNKDIDATLAMATTINF